MTYAQEFELKISREPIKHRIRLLQFQLQRVKQNQRLKKLRQKSRSQESVPVSTDLQPPPYKYREHTGPWIEHYFYERWIKKHTSSQLTYLPVFFDAFFLHSQTHKYRPREFKRVYAEMQNLLQYEVQPDRGYFTVLGMYDFPIWDWHEFPKNILVFSSNGGGDIPIPLLNNNSKFASPQKEILVSFMGRLGGSSNRGGVRQTMYETLKDFAYFDQGSHWRSVMSKSIFTLCPRGLGRASFRLYEALSVGSIPIYIWDDMEWLPYKDIIDWTEISISINVKDCDQIPDLIKAHSKKDIRRKQERIAELYSQFFTFPSVFKNIVRMSNQYKTMSSVRKITDQRQYL